MKFIIQLLHFKQPLSLNESFSFSFFVYLKMPTECYKIMWLFSGKWEISFQ